MSRSLDTMRGHVGVYVGPDMVGTRSIGLQVESDSGSGVRRCLLSPEQARELALELLERAGAPQILLDVVKADPLEALRS